MQVARGEMVPDPVSNISISGVHGRKELEQRLAIAASAREDGDSGFAGLVAGALIGAALMYFLHPGRGARRVR